MPVTDPQFLYLVLLLPALFGMTLIGEGVYKVAHEEWSGLLTILFGLLFMGTVVFTYIFFSNIFVGLKTR